MGSSNRKRILFPALVLLVLLLPGTSSALELKSFFTCRQFLPPGDIVQLDHGTPSWKTIWDEARKLARKGKLAEALTRYTAATKLAGNLRQLSWEQGVVLVSLEKWKEAAAVLEPLVEEAPAEVDFITTLGLVKFEQGRYKRAQTLFDLAAKLDSGDIRGLAGRVQTLIAVDRKEEALPLLQELFRRRPNDRDIKKGLASLAFELKRYSLARRYVVPLAASAKADAATLKLAARVNESLHRVKAASHYWKRLLAREPENREAHGRLALYYENIGRYDRALVHLRAILAGDENNASILQRICRLLVRQDRFTEALPYFERYIVLRPDDRQALREIINLNVALGKNALDFYRRILSISAADDPTLVDHLVADLLEAGDGDGALFVYEHMLRISADKVPVLMKMLPLLERLGRQDRLIRALNDLLRLVPDDYDTARRLVGIYLGRGDLAAAGDVLGRMAAIPGIKDQADFLALRGRYRRLAGSLNGALADFLAYIEQRPWDDAVREECVSLAGRLGLIVTLRRLVADFAKPGGGDERSRLIARAYAEAGAYREALAFYSEMEGEVAGVADKVSAGGGKVLLAEADLLLRAGMDYEAEGILFKALAAGGGLEAARMLFDHYLPSDRRLAAAVLKYAAGQYGDADPAVILMSARLLVAKGRLSEAYDRCAETFAVDQGAAGRDEGLRREINLLMADILARQGRFGEAERLCLTMMGRGDNLKVVALLYRIYRNAGAGKAAERLLDLTISGNSDPAAIISLSEAFEWAEQPAVAADLAARVLAKLPQSLKAWLIRARNLEAMGRPGDAVKALTGSPLFATEDTLQAKAAVLLAGEGEMERAASLAAEVVLSWPERMDMHLLNVLSIIRKRGRHAAENAVAELFDPELDSRISKAVEEAGVKPRVSSPRRSLWEVITFNRGH